MRIVVTGSIATDHLMSYDGRFADALIADQLENVSLSFLVEDLEIRRGGVAANICFNLANLGLRPVLLGAVGQDFDDYRSWLDRHGVDTESVHESDLHHTARFVCTTDSAGNQIASFYPGAMSVAREIELRPVAERLGGIDLVVISPNAPEAMLRHTEECRDSGVAFAADPSQQLSSMDGEQIKSLIDGASYLFTNEYEAALIESKTGWSSQEILERVGTRITTHGARGSKIETEDGEPVLVPVVEISSIVDPTGVGDAFRAGYLAGVSWGLGPERCAQVGSTLAALVIETTGTQEYELDAATFLGRLRDSYGPAAADEVRAHLTQD
ncbi:MAG: carbohydrate kinase family protein [Candidatus Nanopelagicales bacterium]